MNLDPVVYAFKGGVEFTDYTCGAVVISRIAQTNMYTATVSGKPLKFPVSLPGRQCHFSFEDGKKLSACFQGALIKFDYDGASYYVDRADLVEGVAYNILNYIPKKLSDAEVDEKLKTLPEVQVIARGHNKYGAVVIAKVYGQFKCYFANPSASAFSEIPTRTMVGISREGTAESLQMWSKDQFFYCSYQFKTRSMIINL